MQSVALLALGVTSLITRNNEIKLYDRLNDQLTKENNRLHELLYLERDRYDELKGAFDKYLGIDKSTEEAINEINESIGGFVPYSRKASKLSLASRRKLDAEDSGE